MRVTILIVLPVLILAGVVIALPVTPAPAGGPTIVVDTTDDENNNDGDCSLREALSATSLNIAVDSCPAGHPVGPDTIVLQSGQVYTLSLGFLDAGGPGALTIKGDAGPGTAIIDGGDSSSVLRVTADSEVLIMDLTIRNGQSGNIAGGIWNTGDLTIEASEVINNSADSNGGGILTSGTLSVSNSLISNNHSGLSGGGISNAVGTTTITDSVISGNTAVGGGGISNKDILNVERTLISGNTAAGSGGGINNNGFAALLNVTISGNEGGGLREQFGSGFTRLTNVSIVDNTNDNPDGPLGIEQGGGEVIMVNTIVSNGDGSRNCEHIGGITSNGYNLETGDTCGLAAFADQTSTDPLLGPLQDNSGPSFTHALLDGSPALSAADAAVCPTVDQRGKPRPAGDGCDIGAYESGATAPTPSPSPEPTDTPTPTATPALTPTATPPPPGEAALTQGDNDCDGDTDAVDALTGLRHVAAISFSQEPGCPAIGDSVPAAPAGDPPNLFGDVDCDDDVDAVDALGILRKVVAFSVSQNEPCTDIGEPL